MSASMTTPQNIAVGGHIGASLLSLSPELILEIASHIISWQDLRLKFKDPSFLTRFGGYVENSAFKYDQVQKHLGNIRLVCRYLSQVLHHAVYKAITFDFHLARFTVDSIESKLSSLSESLHPSHIHTHFLRIHCLDLLWQGYRTGTTDKVTWFYPTSADAESQTRALALTQSIGGRLTKAITSFRNLRCVAWNIDDPNESNVLILEALSSLLCLEDVTLSIKGTCLSPSKLQLDKFSGLRSLSIDFGHPYRFEGKREDEMNLFTEQLARVVSQSPLLSYLHLIQKQDNLYNLDGLIFFQGITKIVHTRSLLQLTYLRIQTAALSTANQTTINLLKSVKCLHLSEFPNIRYSSDQLWERMQVAGIKLHELTINSLSKPLLAYLASFSTLQTLHVEIISDHDADYSITECRSLYDTILPLHGLSLTIQAPADGRTTWDLELKSEDEFDRPFHGIKYERHSSTSPVLRRESLITVCMDTVPQSFPFLMENVLLSGYERLERLAIDYSATRRLMRCGNGASGYSNSIHAAGAEWLSDLRVPAKKQYLYPKEVHLPYESYKLESKRGAGRYFAMEIDHSE